MSLGRRDSSRSAARVRLVLLRGGLDAGKAAPETDDWSAFTLSIGFQPRGLAPADDFEERLAERILRTDTRERSALESTLSAPHFGTLSHVTAVTHEPKEAASRGRALRFASMGAAAAAILFIALATLLSSTERPSARERVTPDPDLAKTAERARDSETREAPKPKKVDTSDKPDRTPPLPMKPPGTLRPRMNRAIAQGGSRSEAPNETSRVSAHAEGSLVPLEESIDATQPSDRTASVSEVSPLLPRVELASLPSGWADVEATPIHQASKSAAWSVSTSDRWYGVALAPTREPSASVGVVAELDLGRALEKL